MKVNTDGVLLGAAMTVLPSDRRLLDVGTGTGVIALMAAQRLASSVADFRIVGIDIDGDSGQEAADNFAASPWVGNLTSLCTSLDEFAAAPRPGFDVIFSNPPYFESSLKAPDLRRRAARHAETMSYRDIVAFASCNLTQGGRLSLILPSECEREACRYAASFSLELFRVVRVRTSPRRQISRVILEWCRTTSCGEPVVEEITIQKEGGYSDEYRSLVKDFLLNG